MRKPWECPICHKPFKGEAGTAMHIADKHQTKYDFQLFPIYRPNLRERAPGDESLADIAVNAELKRACGEDLDELESSLIGD